MKKLTLLFMAIIAFTAIIAQEVPANWTLDSADITVTEETTTVSEGTSAVSVTWTSQDNQDIDSDVFAVTAEASYSYTLDVYDFDAAGRVRMAIAWNTENTYSAIYSEDIDDWQTLTLDGTVPVGATTAQIRLRFYDVSGDWAGSATVIVDNASYTEDGGLNLILNPSFDTWETFVPDPTLTVTAPLMGATVAVDNVDIAFSVENFVLDTDGSFEYILNGETAQYATASPVNVTGLIEGVNTIEMQLVDILDLPLVPAVTVTRTVNYEIPSVDPALTIDFPIEGSTVYGTDLDITFTVENFGLGTDGKIAYSVNGDPTVYHTTTDAISLTSLTYAEHTVDFELVTMADASLDPAVVTSVTFTAAELVPGGMETFELSTIGSTYTDGSFTGDEGFAWNYFHSRDTGAYPINLKGLMLRRGADSKLESTSISGGIASFQLSMIKAFTGASVRQLELYINDVLVGTSEEFGAFTGVDATVYTFYVSDINVPGDFTIKVKPVGTATTNAQVVIDDISWTGYESTDPYLSITSPTDAQEVTTADVDITFNVLNFDLGTDGSVKYTVDGDADIFVTTSPVALTSLADGSHTVTMELVNMSDASLIPAVTDAVTFTVNTVAPTTTPIYDIQYTTDVSGNSPLMDQTVITTGFVTAVFEDKFWLQDITSAWNGVYVYYTTTPGPARGDSVMVSGTVVEYNNLTEIGTVTNMTVLTSGNTLPAADAISTVNIGDEDYEGVLVTVTGICTNPDAGYGMWVVNDGSGAVAMDDLLYAYTPVLGNSYTITGVVDYSFDEWKILPRDAADIIDNGVSTDPLLIVTYPANNETIYQTSLDLTYTVSNFTLGTDGNVAWNVDGATDAYVTTSPIAISGLTDGAHVINLELVDMSNDPLDPAVTVAVNITVNLSGPTYTSISDIQNGIVTGDVWVKAVVSANFNGAEFGEGYYLQQGGGEWNGIYVFDESNIPSIGDSVVIAGSIDEFFDMTQIESVTSYSVIGIDGIVASPTAVTTLSAASEEYESVLVKVVNATCDTIQNGFGEWWVNDGSGLLMCKDNGVFDFTEVLGTSYDITGIIGYSYSKFSIQYRRESDISVHSGIDSEFANTISLYPNPATDLINVVTEGAETIVITNMVGQVIAEVSVKSEIETINISEYPAGVYFVKITKANESAVVKMIIE